MSSKHDTNQRAQTLFYFLQFLPAFRCKPVTLAYFSSDHPLPDCDIAFTQQGMQRRIQRTWAQRKSVLVHFFENLQPVHLSVAAKDNA
jgi:hypothetical protein